jgi:superfamily II DNA or RNA helicase
MKFTPRPYQAEARDAALREFDRGVDSTLIVMPTGTGKTVVFALVGDAREWGRVLVLAGRIELIEQARDKIQMVTGERPDIEMGQMYAPTLARDLFSSGKYVCGSVQTLCKHRRLSRFDWRDFGLVIVDEAHHALAPTYRRIVERIREENRAVKVLYVTATPDRGDGKALGQVCSSVAYNLGLPDAIDQGWLVPIHQAFADITGLDFSHVRTVGGELDSDAMDEIIADDGGSVPHKIAAEMIKRAGREKAVIFTPGVESAYKVAEIIRRTRPDLAVAMDGTWDRDKRRSVLAAYERGEFQFLLNCNLFLEGWDSPTTSVIGIARPMKQRNTYAQAVGRGLRPLPNLVDYWNTCVEGIDPNVFASARREAICGSSKPRTLVVDIVGNAGRHKLVCTADLLGGDLSPVVVARARKRAEDKSGNSDMKKLLQEEQDREIKKREAAEERRAARKRKVYGETRSSTTNIDPFHNDVAPAMRDGFDHQEELASAGQVEYLESLGVAAAGMRKRDATKLIGKSKLRRKLGLCTLRQLHLLAKHSINGERLTMPQAGAALDLISANGWSRPASPIAKGDLSIRPQGGKYQLLVSTGGRKIGVGKPHDSVDSAREYGRVLLGTMPTQPTEGGE